MHRFALDLRDLKSRGYSASDDYFLLESLTELVIFGLHISEVLLV